MKIDEFNKEQQSFLLGNLLQMSVTNGHPEFLKVATLLDECTKILKNSLGIKEEPVAVTAKPLASAARSSPNRSKRK
jgi:hypothetical protein